MPAAAIGIGASLLGGIFGRKKEETTTESGSSRPYFTDRQNKLQGNVQKLIQQLLKGKETKLDRQLKVQMGEDVNAEYAGTEAQMDSALTSRGFGESGKHNMNTLQMLLAKNQTTTRGLTSLAQDRQARQMQALGLGGQIAFNPTGSDTTGKRTTPGESLLQGLGNGLSRIGS